MADALSRMLQRDVVLSLSKDHRLEKGMEW